PQPDRDRSPGAIRRGSSDLNVEYLEPLCSMARNLFRRRIGATFVSVGEVVAMVGRAWQRWHMSRAFLVVALLFVSACRQAKTPMYATAPKQPKRPSNSPGAKVVGAFRAGAGTVFDECAN